MLIDNRIFARTLEKKKLLDSLRPLPKEVLRKLNEQLEIELTYNSNAIEGNTLTLQETKLVLERGITVKGKSLREHLEATNHKEALHLLERFVKKKEKLMEDLIKELHKVILTKINDKEAGRYRKTNVRILGAIKSPPQFVKVPILMKRFADYAKKNPDKFNIVEFSAKLHYEFVAIHPFFDGNGRVARLLMNLLLIQNGYPIIIILNNDRKRYYATLKEADRGNIKPFIDFIAKAVERSLDIYLSTFKKGLEYISLKEAAKISPYSQEYLSLLARKGILDAAKFGRNWVITKKALNDYIKKHRK